MAQPIERTDFMTAQATSSLGGPSRAVELTCGIHSRSSIFPKREPLPPMKLGFDPGHMWRPESNYGYTRFRLPHPTKGFTLGRTTSNADYNPKAPMFDTSKYVHFLPGQFHGLHAPRINNPAAVKEVTMTPKSIYTTAGFGHTRVSPPLGEQVDPRQRQAAVSQRRHTEIMREHSKVRLSPAQILVNDPAGLPYLKEAEASNRLYQHILAAEITQREAAERKKAEQQVQASDQQQGGKRDSTRITYGTPEPPEPSGKESSLMTVEGVTTDVHQGGGGSHVVSPAVRLPDRSAPAAVREAAGAKEEERATLYIARPVQVPLHGTFRLRVPRAATDAKLRSMYTTEAMEADAPLDAQYAAQPSSRRTMGAMGTNAARHRRLVGEADYNAPLYWLPRKASTMCLNSASVK